MGILLAGTISVGYPVSVFGEGKNQEVRWELEGEINCLFVFKDL